MLLKKFGVVHEKMLVCRQNKCYYSLITKLLSNLFFLNYERIQKFNVELSFRK